MEEIVVKAQREKKDSDNQVIDFSDGQEHGYVVQPARIERAKTRSLGSVNCGGGLTIEKFGVTAPIGATRAHTHPDSYGDAGSVPGGGNNAAALGSSAHTAFTMTSKNAFTIEAFPNGTYRVTVHGASLTSDQRAGVVAAMEKWESPASNAAGATDKQKYCKKK